MNQNMINISNNISINIFYIDDDINMAILKK